MSETGPERVEARVIVRGRVQGVGYRAWTQHQAQLHGLSGWVGNLGDGSVEALFAGSADMVAIVVNTLRRGPRGAWVEALEEYPATPEDVAEAGQGGFVVRGSAGT